MTEDDDTTSSDITLGSQDSFTDYQPTDTTSESMDSSRSEVSLGSAGTASLNNKSDSSSLEDDDAKNQTTIEEIKAWWMQQDWERLCRL